MFQETTLGSIEVIKVEDVGESGDLTNWDALGAEDKLNGVIVSRDKKRVPDALKTLVTISHQFCKKDKNASLGLIYRKGMVTRLQYASPFKGYIFPGDIILTVNGTKCTFEEGPEKTAKSIQGSTISTLSRLRLVKKKSSSNQKMEFKDIVSKLMAQKGDFVKIDMVVARLKSRIPMKVPPPETQLTPGFVAETAYVYMFKFMKLGLALTHINNKVFVNYTALDSASYIGLNTGETVLLVDDKPVATLEEVRQLILNGCNINGFVRILVEFPESDALKNQVRNTIMVASKNDQQFCQHYTYGFDVRKYMEEGIEALQSGKEPVSIFREVIDEKDKKQRKKLPVKYNSTKPPTFVEKTEEVSIPTEWNTKLIVALPGPKQGPIEKKLLAEMKEQMATQQNSPNI